MLRARWVTLSARWVTLRARWVTLRARWVTLRDRWVTLRARWVTPRARCVMLRELAGRRFTEAHQWLEVITDKKESLDRPDRHSGSADGSLRSIGVHAAGSIAQLTDYLAAISIDVGEDEVSPPIGF
jgi:hypothetical protein